MSGRGLKGLYTLEARHDTEHGRLAVIPGRKDEHYVVVHCIFILDARSHMDVVRAAERALKGSFRFDDLYVMTECVRTPARCRWDFDLRVVVERRFLDKFRSVKPNVIPRKMLYGFLQEFANQIDRKTLELIKTHIRRNSNELFHLQLQ